MVLYFNMPPHPRVSLAVKHRQCIGSLYLMLKFNFYVEEWMQTRIKLYDQMIIEALLPYHEPSLPKA